MTEAYVLTASKVFVPERFSQKPDVSPLESDPLAILENQIGDLNYMVKNGLGEGIIRDNFPDVPTPILVVSNYTVTENQVKLLDSHREKTDDPTVRNELTALMLQLMDGCELRVQNLLEELGDVSISIEDEDRIKKWLNKEIQKPQEEKGSAGFNTPSRVVQMNPENSKLLPAAQE